LRDIEAKLKDALEYSATVEDELTKERNLTIEERKV